MLFTKPFSQLTKDSVDIAGGKGASLGEMLNAGIPVPPGFVVLSSTFDRFLHETDLVQEVDAILDTVNIDAMHTVEEASRKIQALILSATMPEDIANEIQKQFAELGAEFVAVRSSATSEDSAAAAWAGQLDSFLNTTQDSLLQNVQKCWASLFTPRAIFYRFELEHRDCHSERNEQTRSAESEVEESPNRDISQKKENKVTKLGDPSTSLVYSGSAQDDRVHISVAVVVQKMVNSEKSGIAFSVHPVTEDYNQMIIEAGFGLGEAIVSGQVTPDSYVVSKDSREIIDVNVAEQTRMIVRNLKLETGNKKPASPAGRLETGNLKLEIEQANEWVELGERGSEQVLCSDDILVLAELIMRIEQHYGFPCDIEWAYEDGEFFIVQSRPITTLTSEKFDEKKLLVKTLTRDVPVIAIESYYDGIVKRTEQFFDMPFSENLYLFTKGTTEIYRENESFNSRLPFLLSEWVHAHKDCIPDTYQGLYNALDVVGRVKNEKNVTIDTIFVLLKELKEAFADGFLGIITTFWFPIWQQKYAAGGQQLFDTVLIEELQDIRQKTDSFFDASLDAMYMLLDKLADIKKWDKTLLKFITWDELQEVCDTDLNVYEFQLEKRKNNAFAYFNGNIIFETELSDVLSTYGYNLQKVEVDPLKFFSGMTAFKGMVEGRARIILNRDQLDDIVDGEILVAPMTTPWYVPAMKKALAIITDEGGITCHAAIVSRELGKPCIIGTKIATQILKDGDLVEVDADNGVVRILERAGGSGQGEDDSKENSKKIIESFLSKTKPEDVFKMSFEFIPLFWTIPVFFLDKNLSDTFTPTLLIKHKDESHLFVDSNYIFGYAKKVLENYLNNNDTTIEKVENKYRVEVENTNRLYDELMGDKKYNEEKLQLLLKENLKIFKHFFVSCSLAYLDHGSIFDLIEHYPEIDEKKIKKILDIDIHKSFELIHEEIILKFKENKNDNYESLSYLFTSYSHIPNKEEIKQAIEKVSLDVLKQSIQQKNNNVESNVERHQKLYNKLNFKEKHLVDFIQMIKRIREDRKQYFSKLFFSLYTISDLLLKEWQIAEVKNGNVFACELLKGKTYVEQIKNEILKREDGYIFYCDSENEPTTKPFSGNTEFELQNLKDTISKTDLNFIKGEIAYKGKVSGNVAVAIKNSDFSKIKENDILVTSMTRPEVLPYLKKVKAIITDEGGVTCHAAIISRELKIPCIIGTKTATHILHDGDLVEVDADNGIVRILERKDE